MRSRNRGRWITPFRFIMVTGLGILGAVAWKMDLLPFQVSSAPTGALHEQETADKSSGKTTVQPEEYKEPVLEEATILAQSEPPAEELSDGDDNQRLFRKSEVEMPRVYTRTLNGAIVEAETSVDPLFAETEPPAQFKGAARPVEPQPEPTAAMPEPNAPAKLNPPEGIKRASNPVIKTAKHASFKEEIGGEAAKQAVPDLIAIDELISQRKIIEAHKRLSKIYWDQPEVYPVIKSRIEETARMIYFAPQPHFMKPYEIEPGDQLRKVAQQYGITWEYLAKLNQIDPKRIRPGQKLKVIKGPFHVFVDLSDFTLTVHSHGYFVKRYTIGTGKDHSTPTGKFVVKDKLVDPTYYGPDGVIANDDPTNPLGERWIDIGDSYGIHGTIDPASIGKAESKGCVRMQNDDVAEVYDLLGVGSEVVIRP
ncbi:Putative L,D-transpeptidase YkuD [Gimesia chilikensis]|uniref:L,D-transpeptidase YkuD n=1 Tax=Gimesia chilikensis TaxID=2605989 RepID=A0A517W5W4_9PLAN|nr:L,D-transpeptidase family protein [Gimesia chilikensis]QDU00648.1 Putative L,D-transpeptidase YkuD [Gimesia chilikensis]